MCVRFCCCCSSFACAYANRCTIGRNLRGFAVSWTVSNGRMHASATTWAIGNYCFFSRFIPCRIYVYLSHFINAVGFFPSLSQHCQIRICGLFVLNQIVWAHIFAADKFRSSPFALRRSHGDDDLIISQEKHGDMVSTPPILNKYFCCHRTIERFV